MVIRTGKLLKQTVRSRINLEMAATKEMLEIALEIQPELADAYINLGLILKSKNQLGEAEKTTLKAIEIKPNSADAYLNLGTILQEQGRLLEAFNLIPLIL